MLLMSNFSLKALRLADLALSFTCNNLRKRAEGRNRTDRNPSGTETDRTGPRPRASAPCGLRNVRARCTSRLARPDSRTTPAGIPHAPELAPPLFFQVTPFTN